MNTGCSNFVLRFELLVLPSGFAALVLAAREANGENR